MGKRSDDDLVGNLQRERLQSAMGKCVDPEKPSRPGMGGERSERRAGDQEGQAAADRKGGKSSLYYIFHFARPSLCGRGDRRCCWILVAGLLILPFLFYLFTAIGRTHVSSHFDIPRPKGFSFVIDGGPTMSRPPPKTLLIRCKNPSIPHCSRFAAPDLLL
ncbi:hypothetical protein Cni_G09917 [Canna indica]|uniref:Uncharacterized protein n=1 Tax=Canna indica TaxID=4628 RepID=A0AAQ3K3D6_9LILI|nr:hypothetical protein Cni_G09917 [Canna indica]